MLSACGNINSDELAQKAIYSSYEVSYSEDSQQFLASAWFTVGGPIGSFVNLDSGSMVSFDGISLSPTSSLFHDISYDYSKSLSPSAVSGEAIQFMYKDDSGTTYTNSASLPARVSIGAVSKQGGNLLVNWSTASGLGGGEPIRFLLSSSSNNSSAVSYSSDFASTSGQTSFSPQALASLGGNSATLLVCRTNSVVTNAPAQGGSFELSYCSASQLVNW